MKRASLGHAICRHTAANCSSMCSDNVLRPQQCMSIQLFTTRCACADAASVHAARHRGGRCCSCSASACTTNLRKALNVDVNTFVQRKHHVRRYAEMAFMLQADPHGTMYSMHECCCSSTQGHNSLTTPIHRAALLLCRQGSVSHACYKSRWWRAGRPKQPHTLGASPCNLRSCGARVRWRRCYGWV